MKKIKKLFPVLLAVLVMLSLALTACSPNKKKNEGDTSVTETLVSISVDSDNAKKEYYIGEEFSYDGIVVTASVKSSDKTDAETRTLTSSDYTVDSTAYNKDVAGTYKIVVSYTLGTTTKIANYSVDVLNVSYDGLSVKVSESFVDTINLTADAPTASIDLNTVKNNITVSDINVDGTVGSAITDYSIELYKGDVKCESTEGLDEGAYQIWLSKASDRFANYTRTCFVIVYVVNDLESISFVSGTKTQEVGKDVISDTWTYTATYANGATKSLSADDVTVTIDTKTAGENLKATVQYVSTNCNGVDTTKTVEVEYTITNSASSTPTQSTNVTINISDLALGNTTAGGELVEDSGVYTTSSLVIDSNNKSLNGLSFTQRLKLNGTGAINKNSLKFVVTGPATITVYAITSSSSALDRTLSLYDSTYTTALSTTGGIPNAVTEYSFEVSEAGTYYLGGSAAINLYYITVVYTA
jgi:hypothetical protein